MKVSETLRRVIEKGPESRYSISKRTGISQGVLSRFVHDEREINTGTLDTLCEALDLELVPRRGRRRK